MSLEDEISDVLGKALRGLEMKPADVAEASGLSCEAVQAALNGKAEEAVIRRAGEVLGLDGEALVNLPSYTPARNKLSGIRRIELPFGEWTVNAWLLEKNGTQLLFDTGWGSEDIIAEVDVPALDGVFITHGHVDHIGGINALNERGAQIVSEREALEAGEFLFGEIGIKTVDLSGHCEPAAGYFVSGFERQLLIVGDAIFAGSVGGCSDHRQFDLAFKNLRNVLEGAHTDCLILPGHGPLTSVSEEIKANPFKGYFS